MLRILGSFFAVFALLSLIVHLNELTVVFGGMAALLLACDAARTYLLKAPRSVRSREPIL